MSSCEHVSCTSTRTETEEVMITLPSPGAHLAMNACAAAACAYYGFGIQLQDIADALKYYEPEGERLQVRRLSYDIKCTYLP